MWLTRDEIIFIYYLIVQLTVKIKDTYNFLVRNHDLFYFRYFKIISVRNPRKNLTYTLLKLKTF